MPKAYTEYILIVLLPQSTQSTNLVGLCVLARLRYDSVVLFGCENAKTLSRVRDFGLQ